MTRTFARKRFRNSFAATALLVIAACSNVAQAATYTMYRDPGCGCCLKWANHFENGMDAEVATVDTTDMGSVKADKGVPSDLWSCPACPPRGPHPVPRSRARTDRKSTRLNSSH